MTKPGMWESLVSNVTMQPDGWLRHATLDSVDVMLNDTGNAMTDSSDVTEQLGTSAPEVTGSCQDDQLKWMRYVCNVIIALPIASLGIVANLVSFVVLRHQKPRLTTTVLLQGLALADTAVLMATTLLYFLRYVSECNDVLQGYMENYANVFRWVYPATSFFRMASTWLTVLLTIDRYIAVCHPLHAMGVCTIKAAKRHLAIVVLAAFLCSVPRFFEYDVKSGKIVGTFLLSTRWYAIGYRLIAFFVLMYLVPMALMVILNSRLLCALHSASAYRVSMPHVNTQTRANNRSITIVVLTIVMLCVVGDMTAMVDHLLYAITEFFEVNKRVDTFRRYLTNVRVVIVTVNSAGNFVIYCMCSRNFRLALRKTFVCSRDSGSCFKRQASKKKKPLNTGSTYYLSLTRSLEKKPGERALKSGGRKYECNLPLVVRKTKESRNPSAEPMPSGHHDQKTSNPDGHDLHLYMKLFHSHGRK